MDLEKVYDEEIAPLMTQIINICNKHELPMIAEFEYSPGRFCKTALLYAGKYHPLMKHLDVLSQCGQDSGVNIDKYMLWVARGARVEGHTSIVLGQMGIPERPEPPKAN